MVELEAVTSQLLAPCDDHNMTLKSSNTYNSLEGLQMTSLHDVRLVVAA